MMNLIILMLALMVMSVAQPSFSKTISEVKIIFADEPSGNLDSENAKQLHNLFLDLRDKFGYTFIIVTKLQIQLWEPDQTINFEKVT